MFFKRKKKEEPKKEPKKELIHGDLAYEAYENKDYKTAIAEAELGMKENDPVAYVTMGVMYLTGDGVETDYNKSIYYHEKAAELGYPPAMSILADFFQHGKFVEQDFEKAVYYREKLVYSKFGDDKDYIEQFNEDYFLLGIAYEQGIGTKVNLERAFEYIKKAKSGGNEDAEAQYYYYLIFGKGTEQDETYGRMGAMAAAAKGNKKCQDMLEAVYENADWPKIIAELREELKIANQ